MKKKVVLSGGGDSIFTVLKGVANEVDFSGKSVAYLAIAAETNESLLTAIRNGFSELQQQFVALGARAAKLVESSSLEEAFESDIIIISGGDTRYLLDTFQKENFKQRLEGSNVQTVVGISAGAIALGFRGVGTSGGMDLEFEGIGFVREFVVPHSSERRKTLYPEAIHLADYETIVVEQGTWQRS